MKDPRLVQWPEQDCVCIVYTLIMLLELSKYSILIISSVVYQNISPDNPSKHPGWYYQGKAAFHLGILDGCCHSGISG